MALLAEELVEEWLNRNEFFTIRGIKLGYHEIDLLAIGFEDGKTICRHDEVQASARPILSRKEQLRNELCQGNWKYELVVHQVRHGDELKLIDEHGVLLGKTES